jgi:hypothetical protein
MKLVMSGVCPFKERLAQKQKRVNKVIYLLIAAVL